jgi:hypothetical protein
MVKFDSAPGSASGAIPIHLPPEPLPEIGEATGAHPAVAVLGGVLCLQRVGQFRPSELRPAELAVIVVPTEPRRVPVRPLQCDPGELTFLAGEPPVVSLHHPLHHCCRTRQLSSRAARLEGMPLKAVIPARLAAADCLARYPL